MRLTFILRVAAACALANLHAAPDTPDATFMGNAGTYYDKTRFGGVASILVQPDGKILAGSNHMPLTNPASPQIWTSLVRFNPDGTIDTNFYANVDLGEDANGSAGFYHDGYGTPEVHALGLQSDGKIIAGGDFQGFRNNLASAPGVIDFKSNTIVRLNADGTIDTSFQTNGAQMSNGLLYIEDLTVDAQDRILCAGGFGGFRDSSSDPYTTRYGLARLNADGSLDTTFQIDPQALGVPSGVSPIYGYFQRAITDTSGKIYVTGEFSWGYSYPRPSVKVFARLFPDGSLDPSFAPTFADIIDFVIEPDGKITALGNDNGTRFFKRFNTDGSVDPSFNFPGGYAEISARPLRRSATGQYLLAVASAQDDDKLIRVNANGSIDPTFDPIAIYNESGKDPHFSTWDIGADGKIYAGGFFDEVESVTAHKIVAFEGDYVASSAGTIRLAPGSSSVLENGGSFPIAVSRTGGSTGAASVNVTASSGSATAGSDFTAVTTTVNWADGESGIKYVHVPITNDGSQEGNEFFNVFINSPTGATTTNPTAGSVTILDDETPALISSHPASQTQNAVQTVTFSVGIVSNTPVTFQWRKNGTNIPGATTQNYTTSELSMTDSGSTFDVVITSSAGTTTSNAATLTVLSPDGTPAPSWTSPTLPANPQNPTSAPDGTSYVYTQPYSQPPLISRLLADGSLDAAFTSPAITQGGNNGSIFAIAAAPDGKLYIRGGFDSVDGIARPGIVRLNIDGSVDTTFAPDWGATHYIPGSEIHATTSGVYVVLQPNSGNRGLARLADNGSIDTTFKFGDASYQNTFLSVRALKELPDGRVLVGYLRGFGSSVSSWGFTRLEADGDIDSEFTTITNSSAGLTHYPAGIAIQSDGSFYFATNNELGLANSSGGLDPGFSLVSPSGGQIRDIALVKGNVIAAGAFTGIAGETVGRIARFNSDGSLDTTFPGGPGADNTIDHLNLLNDGTLLVSGSFDTFNTASYPKIVKLLMSDPAVELITPAPVWENDGSLTVTLRRTGSADAAISVDLTSQSGTATEGSDFTAVNTTVNWAAGDATDKTITINLTNDSDTEGSEVFSLLLANPVGTTLVNNSVTATIRDDESVPTIDTQPVTSSVLENGSATFSVNASSGLALSYQWFFNGTAISGATNSTLTINPATPAEEGDYHVVISTPHESITSDTVQLELVPDPTLVSPLYTSPATAPASGTISIVVPTADGGAIIGGNFTDFGGVAALDYIAKIKEDGSVDSSFTPPTLNDEVRDIKVADDGTIFVVGEFTGRIVKLSATGTEDTTFSTNRGSGGNDPASAVGIFPDGTIAVAGEFDKWNGTTIAAYNAINAHVVRLNADGTLTTARYANPGNNSNYVLGSTELKILSDGRMLVTFATTYSSYPKVRMYHADGTEDTSFTYPFNAKRVDHISEFADGTFLFAGDNSLYQVDQTGSVIATYDTGSDWFSAAIQIDGKIIGTRNYNNPRVQRFLTNQQLDPIYDVGSNFNGNVRSLALRPDGRLWAAGDFSQYDGTNYPRVVLLENQPIDLAITAQPEQVIQDPGTTATFSIQAVGSSAISYQWHKNGTPLSDGGTVSGTSADTLVIANIAEADEGDYSCIVTNASGSETSDPASLIVLGAPEIISISPDADVIEGQSATLEVEALGSGSLSYQWQKNGSDLPGETSAELSLPSISVSDAADYRVVITNTLGSITSSSVSVTVQPNEAAPHPDFNALTIPGYEISTLLELPNGNILVGGSFSSISDGTNTSGSNLAVVSPEGAVIPVTGLSTNGQVLKLALQSNGKILVAGIFGQIYGVDRTWVARLNSDLSLDTSFNTNLTFSYSNVYDVAEDSNGKIVVAGQFSNWGGAPDSAYLTRLLDDGSHDATFKSYANSFVYAVKPVANNKYLIGGWFENYNGNLTSDFVARLNADGSIDSSADYAFNSHVKNIHFSSGGDLYIIDHFNSNVAKLSALGAADATFASNINLNSPALVAAETGAGDVLVGGQFTTAGGEDRNRIAKFNPSGVLDTSFWIGDGFNDVVNAITIASDGSIWVGGRFSTYNGQPATKLIRLKGTPSQTAYQIWATASSLPEALAGFDQDADGDGIDNGMEFLYGLDATTPQAPPTWNPSSTTQDGAAINAAVTGAGLDPAKNYRVVTVRTPLDEKGLTVQLTSGTDLVNFDTNGVHALGAPTIDGDYQLQSYYLTPAAEDSPNLFHRLEISE